MEEAAIAAEIAEGESLVRRATSVVESLDYRALHEVRANSTPTAEIVLAFGAVAALLSGVMPGVTWTCDNTAETLELAGAQAGAGGDGGSASEGAFQPGLRWVEIVVSERSMVGQAVPGAASRRSSKSPPPPVLRGTSGVGKYIARPEVGWAGADAALSIVSPTAATHGVRLIAPHWTEARNKLLGKADVLMQLLKTAKVLVTNGTIPAVNFDRLRPYLAVPPFIGRKLDGSRSLFSTLLSAAAAPAVGL